MHSTSPSRMPAPMSKAPQKPRGTQDMIGEAAARFDHVIETFNRVRKLHGFGRVEVPVFEATAVFARSLGETTDVVSKKCMNSRIAAVMPCACARNSPPALRAPTSKMAGSNWRR